MVSTEISLFIFTVSHSFRTSYQICFVVPFFHADCLLKQVRLGNMKRNKETHYHILLIMLQENVITV